MRTAVSLLAAMLALAACEKAPEHEAPPTRDNRTAAGAVVRLAAVPERPAAGYFSHAVQGDRGALVSVSSSRAERIEMHETIRSGTRTSMRPITRIPARNGGTLVFESGGRHLMIYGLDSRLREGGRIDLLLHFERGAPETVSARVVRTVGDLGH